MGWNVMDINPTDPSLTCDAIEDDMSAHLEVIDCTSQEDFILSMKQRYVNFDFDDDDMALLWDNNLIKQVYLKHLKEKFAGLTTQLEKTKRQRPEYYSKNGMFNPEAKRIKTAFDLTTRNVKSRSVLAHDSAIHHMKYCPLCKAELTDEDSVLDHLYSTVHVNNMANCFNKGSQPTIPMTMIKCMLCSSKDLQSADLNETFYQHIASHSHAVCGISPPAQISKQLAVVCKSELCAYYVNKGIDISLARAASGHTGNLISQEVRSLQKGELKHHPLRLSASKEDENEDTLYKSSAFQTFCMTLGMTKDQVRILWTWQPLFLPFLHIRGKCGLCKENAPNTLNSDKSVSNQARFFHTKTKEHMDFCDKESQNIETRLKFTVPLDVKCFVLSYCTACKQALGQWNSVLTHIMMPAHKDKVKKLVFKRMGLNVLKKY